MPGNGCAEPYFETERIIPFKGKSKKYGVNKLDENYQNGKMIIQPLYDSIYCIRRNLIVARKNGKIGIVNENNNAILPFSYSKIILSKDPNLIGLKINSKWKYYNLYNKPILVLESKFECEILEKLSLKTDLGFIK